MSNVSEFGPIAASERRSRKNYMKSKMRATLAFGVVCTILGLCLTKKVWYMIEFILSGYMLSCQHRLMHCWSWYLDLSYIRMKL